MGTIQTVPQIHDNIMVQTQNAKPENPTKSGIPFSLEYLAEFQISENAKFILARHKQSPFFSSVNSGLEELIKTEHCGFDFRTPRSTFRWLLRRDGLSVTDALQWTIDNRGDNRASLVRDCLANFGFAPHDAPSIKTLPAPDDPMLEFDKYTDVFHELLLAMCADAWGELVLEISRAEQREKEIALNPEPCPPQYRNDHWDGIKYVFDSMRGEIAWLLELRENWLVIQHDVDGVAVGNCFADKNGMGYAESYRYTFGDALSGEFGDDWQNDADGRETRWGDVWYYRTILSGDTKSKKRDDNPLFRIWGDIAEHFTP